MPVEAGSQHWQATITRRLQAGDSAALMELYDATSAIVYAYALQAATSSDAAYQATRDAYLTVWRAPRILGDVRVPVEVRLASLIRSESGHKDPIAKTSIRPDEFSRVLEDARHPVTALAGYGVAGEV
jgi:hypothetical protein